jgi:hypothetical protein
MTNRSAAKHASPASAFAEYPAIPPPAFAPKVRVFKDIVDIHLGACPPLLG